MSVKTSTVLFILSFVFVGAALLSFLAGAHPIVGIFWFILSAGAFAAGTRNYNRESRV